MTINCVGVKFCGKKGAGFEASILAFESLSKGSGAKNMGFLGLIHYKLNVVLYEFGFNNIPFQNKSGPIL